MDSEGNFIRSFGADSVGKGEHHGAENWGVHGINLQKKDDNVWISDFLNHAVIVYNLNGIMLKRTPFTRRNKASSDLDKFDSPAEVMFHGDSAFFVDGDGGKNMRVSRWKLESSPYVGDGLLESPIWTVPDVRPEDREAELFDHPHSLTWHEDTSQLIVADRDNHEIVFMDPETGDIKGQLMCDLDLGPGEDQGRPFGVRSLSQFNADLLLVAVAGNDGVETNHQMFHVIDASEFVDGKCTILQSIHIDPSSCHTPHMMALNEQNGDVYIACNQEPNSNVIRFTRNSGVTFV